MRVFDWDPMLMMFSGTSQYALQKRTSCPPAAALVTSASVANECNGLHTLLTYCIADKFISFVMLISIFGVLRRSVVPVTICNSKDNYYLQAQSELSDKTADLTGTRIYSNKRIAVFSGNIRTKVELSASRDHLVSQLPPTSSWGMEFILAPTYFRFACVYINLI